MRLVAEVAERGNESTVLEQTVRKHIPELEQQLERARQIIATRDRELARMTTAYDNQTEALGIANKAGKRYSEEIERLRVVLESGGAKARQGDDAETPEQENMRLQAEISRLRQQLVQFKEVEVADNAMLRSEMKKLADQMMSGKPSAKKPAAKKVAEAEDATATKSPANDDQDSADTAAPAKKKRARKAPARQTRAKKSSRSLGERLKKLTAKADA